jgi:hypothetical protein
MYPLLQKTKTPLKTSRTPNQPILVTLSTPLLGPINQNLATPTTFQTWHKPSIPTSFTRLPSLDSSHTCPHQHPPELTRLVQLNHLINSSYVPSLDKNPGHTRSFPHQIPQLVQKLTVQRHVSLIKHYMVQLK